MAYSSSPCSSGDKFLKLKVNGREGKLLRAALNALRESEQKALCAESAEDFSRLCYQIKPCAGLVGNCTNLGTHRFKLWIDCCTEKERLVNIIFCDSCWAKDSEPLGLSSCRSCEKPIYDPKRDYHTQACRPDLVVTADSESRTFVSHKASGPEVYHTGDGACGKICDACCRFVKGPVPDWAFVSVDGMYRAQAVCIECRGGGTDEEFIARNAKILSAPVKGFYSLQNACPLKYLLKPESLGVRTVPALDVAEPAASVAPTITNPDAQRKRASDTAPNKAKRSAQ